MTKHKLSKTQQKQHDTEENSKFFLVIAIATVVLVALMYFIMR
jgi:hypothetical protein